VSSHNNNHWRALQSITTYFPRGNSLLPRQYHFQGWKPTNLSGHLVRFVDCKGVMILLDHRNSWDPRMTTQFTDG
jgi:hypothetical protein